MRTTRLRVTMREVEPTVLRVLDVPADVSLPELHDLLQVAIGWTDSHLHQWVTDDARYGVPDPDGFADELGDEDEAGVALRALPARFAYLYDFGDGWEHDVEVLGTGGDEPGVVDGEGPCPPEDVGGPYGYAELRQALALPSEPSDPELQQRRRWAEGWSDRFDLASADLLVRQTVGRVPVPVRAVLDLTAGGVKLTPGGRLPRALVRQVQERYPDWYPLGRPASVEEDLLPLADLHEVLRAVGLLRLRNGTLAPTRAAGDDRQVVRRLRSWFGPDDGFVAILAGDAVALLAAEGPSRPEDLAPRLLDLLGHRWMTGRGEPLDVAGVRSHLYQLHATLVGLDLVGPDSRTWTAGPSARWLLPRATALAHLWSGRADDAG